jgi:hypothetical protein
LIKNFKKQQQEEVTKPQKKEAEARKQEAEAQKEAIEMQIEELKKRPPAPQPEKQPPNVMLPFQQTLQPHKCCKRCRNHKK